MKDEKEHGKGRIIYANNDKLEGIFEEGDCKEGQIVYHNGNYYEGKMESGLYNGIGIFKCK